MLKIVAIKTINGVETALYSGAGHRRKAIRDNRGHWFDLETGKTLHELDDEITALSYKDPFLSRKDEHTISEAQAYWIEGKLLEQGERYFE